MWISRAFKTLFNFFEEWMKRVVFETTYMTLYIDVVILSNNSIKVGFSPSKKVRIICFHEGP